LTNDGPGCRDDTGALRRVEAVPDADQDANVRFGGNVRAGTTLVAAVDRAAEIGADTIQVFVQSSRQWRARHYDEETLDRFRAAVACVEGGLPTFCHATYLINLGASDPHKFALSTASLDANLAVARAIGAAGLVLHPGSHLGSGFEGCVDQVTGALVAALERAPEPGCPILLENTAGSGGTIGRSVEELARLLEAAGDRDDLAICLDTQHLFAAGIAYGVPEEADALVESIDRRVGLERLQCLHVNHSAVGFGAGRDRHANIGEGEIGEFALGSLLGHPALQGLPAILEVPGAGQGPRSHDVQALRRVHALGIELRRSGVAE
jgi:deoxyribonuclease IV